MCYEIWWHQFSRNKLNFTIPKKGCLKGHVFLWKFSQPTKCSLLIKSFLWVEYLRAKKTMRLEQNSMCQCLLLFYPYLTLCGLLWFSVDVKHPVLLCFGQIRKSKKQVLRWPGESVMRPQICEPLFCTWFITASLHNTGEVTQPLVYKTRTHFPLLVFSHCKLCFIYLTKVLWGSLQQ